jgi:hypothetical protein
MFCYSVRDEISTSYSLLILDLIGFLRGPIRQLRLYATLLTADCGLALGAELLLCWFPFWKNTFGCWIYFFGARLGSFGWSPGELRCFFFVLIYCGF